MSKKEKLKEIINTLRGLFAVVTALIVAVTSGIISRSDQNRFDIYFYSGIVLDLFLLFSVISIFKRIVKRTNELEDL